MNKNADPDKYSYSGNGIEFDTHETFSLSDGSRFGKNVIFRADNSSSAHADNRKKYILILGKGSADGSADTTLTTDAVYSVNFS